MDNENIKGLDEVLQRLNKAKEYIKHDLPLVIGVEGVNHFKQSFQDEGFTDSSLSKWKPRASKRPGGTNSQKILSLSGQLADSIDYKIEDTTIIFYSDLPYAEIHNEGGIIQVTAKMKKYFWAQWHNAKERGDKDLMDQFKAFALAKQIKIEKRQYMGESAELDRKIADKIVRDLTNILNGK